MRKVVMLASVLAISACAELSDDSPKTDDESQQADDLSASPDAAACGKVGPNKENRRVNNATVSGAAQQRSGSSTGCPALGALQATDDAIYFCFTVGTGGTWTYLQNVRTGVRGWVLDSLLDGDGSLVGCGF
ncbi:MAG TPA: hypothetical protein VFP84_14430 [Kofleriaceae bacterium]|nr:hypothetical protein [Kofleriaceae bacterium]